MNKLPTLTGEQIRVFKGMNIYWQEIAGRDEPRRTNAAIEELDVLLSKVSAMDILLIVGNYVTSIPNLSNLGILIPEGATITHDGKTVEAKRVIDEDLMTSVNGNIYIDGVLYGTEKQYYADRAAVKFIVKGKINTTGNV